MKGLHRLLVDDTSPSGLVHAVSHARAVVGWPAGTKNTNGYWRVSLGGVMYLAHRVVWVKVHGPIPEGYEVDHKDNDLDNNSVLNLRLARRSENNQNRRTQSNSTTGVKGLSWVNKTQRWLAQVQHNGVYHRITSPDREYAEAWLIVKRAELHGDFANNGVRPHEGE